MSTQMFDQEYTMPKSHWVRSKRAFSTAAFNYNVFKLFLNTVWDLPFKTLTKKIRADIWITTLKALLGWMPAPEDVKLSDSLIKRSSYLGKYP